MPATSVDLDGEIRKRLESPFTRHSHQTNWLYC